MMKEIILEGLDEKIYEYTTKDGLKVYMWVNEKVNSCYFTLSVKYGSLHTKFKIAQKIYEVPNGLAHFLEHIKFNLNAKKTAHDEFAKIGGDVNAFTTFKYTTYLVFATQNKKENLNCLLDFVYNDYFTKKMISKEKGIIVEEANMTSDDTYSVMFFENLKSLFKVSNFRNVITGTGEEIKKIELEDVENAYYSFYHPKNMFLAITGNFNPYEMAKVVEDNLSKKTFRKYSEPVIISETEPKKVNKKYSETKINITYPTIKYSLKIPLAKFKGIENIDLKMITILLFNTNFGATSDFKTELIEKDLALSLSYSVDIYEDYLVITLTSTTNYPDEIINRIKNKIDNLEIISKDIKRKKNALLATLILDYDDIEIVNSKIQSDIINEGKIITDFKTRIENFDENILPNIIKNYNNANVAINVFLPQENQEN